MTTFDVAVPLVLGSAGGRVIMGYTPTVAVWLEAVVVLIALRSTADRAARTRPGSRLIRNRLILLVDGDRILEANLAKAHVSNEQLWEALRSVGVRNLEASHLVQFTKEVTLFDRELHIEERLVCC